MATKNRGKDPNRMLVTAKLAADMATAGICVKIDTSETDELQVAICGDTDEPFGILEESGDQYDYRRICVQGRTIAVANGAISIGDLVDSAAATGKLDTIGAAGNAIGQALEEVTAQDDQFSIMVDKQYYGG